MKKEEYQLQEFHCASNKHQPIHITYTPASPHSLLFKTKSSPHNPQSAPTIAKQPRFVKARSNTICLTPGTNHATPIMDSKGNIVERSTHVFHNASTFKAAASLAKEELEECKEIRHSADDSQIAKQPATLDTMPETDLKQQLADSLSPSPFRNENPCTKEKRLGQFVASIERSTKNILFSKFYGNELNQGNSYHAWKIALKDHIVHTLESMTIVKMLKPVPSHILDKKMLPAETRSPTKKTIVLDLDETLSHCVTDTNSTFDREITVPLNTGEKVKVHFIAAEQNCRLELI